MSLIQTILSIVSFWIFFQKTFCTIDLNSSELQYLADHLTREECRKLIAGAHFKGYSEPKVMDQAGRMIPKDLSCIELLHHWNYQSGEGKGESHELLERRLGQMGKQELADWLGKTVFRELGKDLNKSVENGFKEFVIETTESSFIAGPTLEPEVKNEDPAEWSPIDTILFLAITGLLIVIFSLVFKLCYKVCRRCRERRAKSKVKFKEVDSYNIIEETSGSESEDRFDVRQYSDKVNVTSSEWDS